MPEYTNHQPNIEDARDLLSPYLDGEVTGEERALVEQALATSPELRDDLDTLRQTIALVADLPPVAAHRPFTLSKASALATSSIPRKSFNLPAWLGGLAAAAAVLVCVLAVGGLFLRGQLGGNIQPAAEIAQYAAEEQAAEEEPAAEEPSDQNTPAEEIWETGEIEKEVAVEKEAEKAVEAEAPAPPAAEAPPAELPAEEPAAEEAVEAAPATVGKVIKTEESLVDEATQDMASAVGEVETSPEANVTREADNAELIAPAVQTTATPHAMPTPTVTTAALAAELAEEKAGDVAEGGVEQPTGTGRATTPPAPESQQEQKVSLPTPTLAASPTAPTRLTAIPSDTPLAKVTGVATFAPEDTSIKTRPWIAGLVVALGVIFIGFIVWLVIRRRR
ncbi:MAG: zf-HC2 domain-containing protein [Anaerolineae bacterium]|nr:zf-HC2 domain-containing protein [Anaerolineae bacterium]